MKFAAEEVYYNNGDESRRIIAVSDNCESKNEQTSSYDYYLDVFDSLEDAKAFSPQAGVEVGLEPA